MTAETKTKWLQTAVQVAALVGSMLVFAMAYEHRTTVLEQQRESDRKQVDLLTTNQQQLLKNQERLSVVIEMMEKRHEAEDRQARRRPAAE